MMHYRWIALVPALFLLLSPSVLATSCDSKIIENISKMNKCPTGVLSKVNAMSPFALMLLPSEAVAGAVSCIVGSVTTPVNHTSTARAVIYLNTAETIEDEPLVMRYRQEEEECGHITEYHFDYSSHIYVLSMDPVLCFYRCLENGTEKAPFGGAAVSNSKAGDPATAEAVSECEKSLAAVGVQGTRVRLGACTDYDEEKVWGPGGQEGQNSSGDQPEPLRKDGITFTVA